MRQQPSDGADYGDDYVDMSSRYWKEIGKKRWYGYLWFIFFVLFLVTTFGSFSIWQHEWPLYFFVGIIFGFLAIFSFALADFAWNRQMDKLIGEKGGD